MMRERHDTSGSGEGSLSSARSGGGRTRHRYASTFRRRLSPAWVPVLPVLVLVSVASALSQPQDPPHGDWWIMQQDSRMDDINFHLALTFAQKSPNPAAIEALSVICPEQESLVEIVEIDLDLFDKASVFVARGNRHEFRVRWDNEPPSLLPFVVGDDRDSLFFPKEEIALNDSFIAKLLAHERLLVEVRLLGGAEIFEFSLNGAADAIAEMRELCLG